jgi:aldose 1-epimerase
MSEAPITLHIGRFELGLDPACGGCITFFRTDGIELMRPAADGFAENGGARLSSSYPLVPFSNRIADGRFAFAGKDYQLALNMPEEGHAIHGHGWENGWQVEARSETEAVLGFTHRVDGTPFDYQARQRFTLGPEGLEVVIEVRNQGAGPMPAGLGLHPYFPRSEALTLKAPADHVWLLDRRKLPTEKVRPPAEWDFSAPRRLAPIDIDHCFGGWAGRARLHWPERELSLEIEAEPVFGHLVVYVPPGRDFVCVEPVSHVNDGVNLMARGVEGTGVRVLAPGESLAGRVLFRPVFA